MTSKQEFNKPTVILLFPNKSMVLIALSFLVEYIFFPSPHISHNINTPSESPENNNPSGVILKQFIQISCAFNSFSIIKVSKLIIFITSKHPTTILLLPNSHIAFEEDIKTSSNVLIQIFFSSF